MKTLVIGGAGYIGSHVVKALMKSGHQVTVFDNLSSGLRQNLFNENEFIYGNILIKEDLDSAFSQGFDACIHLAAFKAAGESMIKPEKYSVNNITGTLNILNSATKYNCKNIVFSSSAAIFGNPQKLPIDENHPKNPENYYGFTKLSIEDNLEWYSKLKGINYSALRYFNAAGYDVDGEIYGLEQNPANLIPIVMETACGMRKEMSVFGDDYDTPDGTGVRDYIHVVDLAKGHVLAIEKYNTPGVHITNLGTGKGYSVLDIVETFKRVNNIDVPYVIAPRRPGDIATCYADPTKAKEELGWVAEKGLVEMCEDAYQFVLKNK